MDKDFQVQDIEEEEEVVQPVKPMRPKVGLRRKKNHRNKVVFDPQIFESLKNRQE
jgi:hypothetical protein